MPSCAVKWCRRTSNKSSFAKDGISFHRFPNVPEIKEKWLDATRRENWFPQKRSVICSRHFTPDNFDVSKKKRYLFESAVPTLYIPIWGSPCSASEYEAPSTSGKVQESTNEGSAPDDPTTTKCNELLMESTQSISQKALIRKNADLVMRLKRSRLVIKRLQDSNRKLKNKVDTFKGLLEKLQDKELSLQDNIDIIRLQSSNKQLRQKVIWLKKLLVEQKKKQLTSQQNVVWCAAADEAETDAKIE